MSGGISAALSMASPPVPAPEGRVALVATTLAGSRALWDRDPEATSAALRMATALIRRLLVDHRGYEVTADGEAFLVAFGDALTAARWCLDVQEALLEAEWPEALLAIDEAAEEEDRDGNLVQRGLRIGMALHVGTPDVEVDERTRRTTYAGEDVHRVEQVIAAANGGQVLVTGGGWAALEEAGTHLLDADVTDLGRHRFAGREEAESLVQLLPWRLANRAFPAVRTQLTLRTNLPSDPGLFLGRERLLAAIDRYFQKGRKLVTLKGHGGIGKTRLALRYGGLHVHEYGDAGGVWFCDLAGARSIDGVCHAVARALGIPLRARSLQGTQQLASALAARGRCLLILDNFEQVEQYAEYTVALWARKAPRLRILVTSRHRLGAKGEALVEVTPLDSDEARGLFLARVDDLRPDATLSDEEDRAVDRIIDAVECIPLAVELAAAWSSMLTLPGIAARLEEGHKALLGVENAPDVDPRHRSLRSVMASSWELLTPWEKEALVSCAVFRGGFTAEAASQVLDLGRYRKAPGAFQVLKTLRDKSLVHTAEVPGVPGLVRWDLFDSVQEFASEKLVAMGLRPTLEQRHASTYLAIARRELERVRGPKSAESLDALGAELDNLMAVHERFAGRHPSVAIQAALALDPVLGTRGPYDLHLQVLDGAVEAGLNIKGALQAPARLARAEVLLARGRVQDAAEAIADAYAVLRASDPPDARATVDALNGWVLTRLGQVQDGLPALANAVETLWPIRHPACTRARYRLGLLRLETGEVAQAEEDLRMAKAEAQRIKDCWLEADVVAALGDLSRHRGDPTTGQARYEEALELARALGDKPRQARLLARMGSVAMDLRQGEQAEAAFSAAKTLTDEVGDVLEAAIITGSLGRMRHHEGRGKEAEVAYDEALAAFEEAGVIRWQGIFRGVLGALQHEQGRMEDAKGSYTLARSILDKAGDRRFGGLVLARLGALHADSGEASRAEAAFADAFVLLQSVDDPLGLAALEVHRGHVDLARARAGDAEGLKAARERFRAATTPGRSGETLTQPPAAISNDVRLALRLLRRSMELGKKRRAG